MSVGSAPSGRDVQGILSFLSEDASADFKSYEEEPPSLVGSSKRSRDTFTERGEVEVEDCGSSKGNESSFPLSSKEKVIPDVPKFSSGRVPDRPFPPFVLDKTRSYFCAPKLSYGVACNLMTPKDRANLYSKGLDDLYQEGMNRSYQVFYFSSSYFFHAFSNI